MPIKLRDSFYQRYKVLPTGLVLWLDQLDARSYGDTQNWLNLLGQGRGQSSIEQKTGANQPDLASTYRTFNGTTDFMQEVEIDDETGVTSHQLATVATGARYLGVGVDWSPYATESGTRAYRAVWHSTGKVAWAYIGGADSAEAFGANMYDAGKGVFTATTESWEKSANATLANDAGRLKVTAAVGNSNAWIDLKDAKDLDADLVVGTTYKFTFTTETDEGTIVYKIRDVVNGVTAWTKTASYNGSPTTIEAIFTATHATGMEFQLAGVDAADQVWIDNTTIEPVTAFGTTAVKLYNAKTGGAQTLVGDTGIDANAITALEIYKTDLAITGDMTVLMWVKPDDGQPGTAETLMNKSTQSNVDGFRFSIAATGKVEFREQSNVELTDSAVWANGAASAFNQVGFVYDTSGPSVVIYDDGSVAASSTTVGAISSALLDVANAMLVGAFAAPQRFFNGQIGVVMIFNRALSAAEIQNIFNGDRSRYGI